MDIILKEPIWADHLDLQPKSCRRSWQWAGTDDAEDRYWQVYLEQNLNKLHFHVTKLWIYRISEIPIKDVWWNEVNWSVLNMANYYFLYIFKICWQCFLVYVQFFISCACYCEPHDVSVSFDISLQCVFADFLQFSLEIFGKTLNFCLFLFQIWCFFKYSKI